MSAHSHVVKRSIVSPLASHMLQPERCWSTSSGSVGENLVMCLGRLCVLGVWLPMSYTKTLHVLAPLCHMLAHLFTKGGKWQRKTTQR